MTDNNNKFVFTGTPKTYEVKYLENQQKPKLSSAARSKVVNCNNNYLSSKSTDLVPSYGPCLTQLFINADGCDCNFGITAILICVNGVSKSETITRPNDADYYGLIGRIKFGWGSWDSECKFSLEESFIPSGRARIELVNEIGKASVRHGHQTVVVTDKREWR